MSKKHRHDIVEKELGIPPDYQHKALNSSFFLQSNWHNNKLTALGQMITFGKKDRILDLGSGSGNFEIAYSRRVKEIVAVDYHKEALEFLDSQLKKRRIKNVRTVHRDIREINKEKALGKFDTVVIVDVIEHIQKKEAKDLIENLKKLLNVNGRICVVTPNYKSSWLYIESILDKFTIVPHFGGHQHLAQYYPSNLNNLFKGRGFKTVRISTFNTLSFLIPGKKVSSILSKLELKMGLKFGNLLIGVFENEKK